jgi:hypothetical protein
MVLDYFAVGEAYGLLKAAGDAENAPVLTGSLFLSKSGWIMLSVPNALVRGIFATLREPGIELPTHSDGVLNAHCSVFRPEELATIGGPERITERGHSFTYQLGPLQTAVPGGWEEMGRVWFVKINSPGLQNLRKSYGLSALPNEGKYDFHITVAVRRKHVLKPNEVAKAAAPSLHCLSAQEIANQLAYLANAG